MTSTQFCFECQRAIERLTSRIHSLSLDDAALNAKPDPNTWTIGQTIEHMTIADRLYSDAMRAALQPSVAASTDSEIRFTWVGRMIAKGAGPDGNVPAPSQFHPGSGPHDSTTLSNWTAQQGAISDLLTTGAGRDLSGIRVRNPLIPLFAMNMADCFAILVAHTERHVRQIEARIKR